MIDSSKISVQDEINRAIGVLKARADYIMKNWGFVGEEFTEEEYTALCKAICSLEKWRDHECTHYLPEIARQLIFFKQQAQVEGWH
jgi:hypothetical protein